MQNIRMMVPNGVVVMERENSSVGREAQEASWMFGGIIRIVSLCVRINHT